MVQIQELLLAIEQKFNYYKLNKDEHRNNSSTYFTEIMNEVVEAKAEDKIDNALYLEDELSDILRDYLNLLYSLEKEWKIRSINMVFDHAVQKHKERVLNQLLWVAWQETKVKQKNDINQKNIEYLNSLSNV